MHCGPDQTRIQTAVLGHSLVCSFVCSNRSLIHLLCPARFARALRCAHSFARSLRSLLRSWEVNDSMAIFSVFFFSLLDHSARLFSTPFRSSLLAASDENGFGVRKSLQPRRRRFRLAFSFQQRSARRGLGLGLWRSFGVFSTGDARGSSR